MKIVLSVARPRRPRLLARRALSKLHIYSNSWENVGNGLLDTTGSSAGSSKAHTPQTVCRKSARQSTKCESVISPLKSDGEQSSVPEWGHDDFDSIYVVKLVRVEGRLLALFTRDNEHLDNQSAKCPQALEERCSVHERVACSP
jgi:hypothetical protein